MDAELQQTLDELCDDLLCVDGELSVLQSLTLLALKFPQAQRLLGRSLASRYTGNSDDGDPPVQLKKDRPVKLSVLTKRFLYRSETALSTIELLAALAHENLLNQQRIVRSVTGVRITRWSRIQTPERTTVFDAGKIKKKANTKQQALVLYALTVPNSVKGAFRKWRKRQKLLQNHRIPSGAPPEQGGVPQPCHCDECLGAEQFLPTWQLHFQDLGRWRKAPDADEQTSLASQSSSLTSNAFLHVFLQDFRLCTHDAGLQSDAGAEGDRKRINVFYFVPTVADAESEGNASPPPVFDPLQHVCAIEIDPEIDVQDATAFLKHMSEMTASSSPDPSSTGSSVSAAYDIVQSVILLEGRAELSACDHESSCEATAEPITQVAEGGLAQFLTQMEVEVAGEPVTKSMIEAALSTSDDTAVDDVEVDDEHLQRSFAFISDLDRRILRCVLEFLADDDVVSLMKLRDIVIQPSSTPLDDEPLKLQDELVAADTEAEVHHTPDTEAPAMSSFRFQFTACVETRALLLGCTSDDLDPEASAIHEFSASIPLETLFSGEDSTLGPLALLCIEESELRAILTRCHICFCSNPRPSSCVQSAPNTPIYCHRVHEFVAQHQRSSVSFPDDQDADEDHGEVHRDTITKPLLSAAIATPVPGLPDGIASSLLAKLEALVLSFNTCSASENTKAAFTAKFTEMLSVAIKSCNTRITSLATSQTVNGVITTSEAHRRAGLERCRQCRDLLIQLGKKVKLVLESSIHTIATTAASDALITADQLDRISKLVRKSVAQVQTQSQSVHAWETPDVRVDKLHLSRLVWASGVPDPEFYRERDEQQRENKKKQRQLTQLLMGKRSQQQQQRARK